METIRTIKDFCRLLPNEGRKCLNNSQYNVCMNALGYTYDEKLGRFFKGDSAFLMNVSEDVTDVADLMEINENGHFTHTAKEICDFTNIGAKLIIDEGAIDEYGRKYERGLYCTNYRELYSGKIRVRSNT